MQEQKKISEVTRKCTLCGEVATRWCAPCQQVSYCSQECQRKDWDSHINHCCPYILKSSSEFGRYMIASRKLKPGEVVVFENAIFGGPTSQNESFDNPLCLSCCSKMNTNYKCSTCHWPVCDYDCEKVSNHKDNECSIFARHKVQFPPPSDENPTITPRLMYKFIRLLRGLLLKERKPEIWAELMNLQFRISTLKIENTAEHWMSMKKALGLDTEEILANNEDWSRIDGIFKVNAFGLNRKEIKKAGESWARFVYNKASMMAHSCVSNCSWSMSYSPEFRFKIRTAFTIKKGQMLTVCYNQDLCLLGTHMRQQRTMEGFGFVCRCIRCKDPTELSTNSSSIKCQEQNCVGYLLSLDPINSKSDWFCQKCYVKVPYWVNENLTENLYYKIHDEIINGPNYIEELEKLIKEYSNSMLHANHWVLQECSRLIISNYSERFSQLNPEELNRFIWHIEQLLQLRDILSPGISTERGKLQLKLAQCLFRRNESDNGISQQSPEELLKSWNYIHELLNQTLLFWKDDIANIPVGRMSPPEVDLILEKIEHAKKHISIKI